LAKDADLPTNLTATGIDTLNAIQISWKIPKPYELDAIEIYRGIEYEKPFDRIISLSPTETFYLDKTIASGQRYFYSLKVIDRLGRSSISTNKVFAICQGTAKPLPPVKTIAKASEKGVTIYWLPNGDNIRGFYVYRCEGIDGDYAQISNFIEFEQKDSVPSYVDSDENMRLGISYSYIVKQENNGNLLSDASNAAIVQPLHVKSKAELPMVNLGSTIIDKGVLLTWNLNNSVYGIYGVQVLRKKTDEKSFAKINKTILDLATTSYIDSTIEKNIAYNYCLSFINNKQEELSTTNIVSATIEDLALAPPFNLQGVFENNQVKLSWESSSKNATGFKIYRRTPGKLPQEIGKVGSSVFTFTDNNLSSDDVVIYYITTINNAVESNPCNDWQLIK
jgi:fibronectin type 3 domain-containing protein